MYDTRTVASVCSNDNNISNKSSKHTSNVSYKINRQHNDVYEHGMTSNVR